MIGSVRATAVRAAALVSCGVLAAACTGSPASPSPSVAASAPASVASAVPSVASAAPSESAAASGGAGTVTAKESEFKIEIGATSAAAGQVTFQITNAGTIEHEFVVVRTDLAADKLPIDTKEGEVNEDDPQLKAVDEVEDIAVGDTPKLTVDLPAGHYVLFCNIPGHYAGGMHADFTTSG